MKKTKLLTGIAALALVLGLGACTTTEDETPAESGTDTTTDETSETTPSTPTEEEIEGYTIIFTLYDNDSAVQTAPEYGSLYFQGSPTGSWNDSETGWWEWGGFTALKETTDASGNVAYGATFDIETLNTGSDHTFNIVFTYEGEDPSSSWTPVREDNFSIVIPDDIAIGGVQYVDCTGCYTLADEYPENKVSTEGAYAIVGDFADSSWNESPSTSSQYFIPAGTEKYEVTVTIDNAPTDNPYWTDENQWDAGLRVVYYGTWNLVAGFSQLDNSSTGVGETAGSDNNIVVTWGATYNLTITFSTTNSILLTLVTE